MNGPNTEPCGTPCFIYPNLEDTLLSLLSLIDILRYLFSKYDPINLFATQDIP